ncbi:FtsX-like permease family protein [Corynebacterium silvaticum]|uniref:Macrolide ABC transporter ATP-binding protein n=1 Tax=Corynebacterium silvaticum TaxID=2320431 RepID=A0ACD4PYK3_9CORY|nr:FtsX-like permease family protein [Corynebacterium silvaticum]NON69859.1 macrolide ABC transporter ATP-binding protein [Corynebacterium silvaticum]UWH01018.1 macrolide ABC transporter ATP-binding protein [Corynebacterium silvaticum]UWH03064.1 macrolide ABC transporter ATP-binding protein [Corynebacterium silvaticum]UWH05101.1 macrolide ABC transporter ATP-binding protein [Corynebacterium silvaticum]UXZ27263.1 macrolide ABC transporter ATP-binding protein [Corynebacterium silvaticum]
MTSLSRRLAGRELTTHKIRSGVAISLFALPIVVICAFTNALLGFSAYSYEKDRLPSTYVNINNTVCSGEEEKDATWCVRDREVLDKPDVERFKNLASGIADTFSPVWQLDTSVASSYGADIRLALRTAPQEKGEPHVPARGEIALSDSALSLLGKGVGEKVRFVPWAGAQPLTLTIAEGTDDRSSNVVGIVNKEDINVAQFGSDAELVSARLPQEVSLAWVSSQVLDEDTGQEDNGVSVRSVDQYEVPSRYASFLFSYVNVTASTEKFFMFVSMGALAVILIASIVGTVFAVAARRSIRSTGLLAAIGADPQQLRQIMLWQGAIVGFLGSLVGTVAGLVLGAVLPWIFTEAHVFGFAWDISLLSVAVAVIAGLCAALMPAIRSASMEPVQALAEGASTRIVRLRPLYLVGPALGALGLISIMLSDPEKPVGAWSVIVVIGAIASAPATILFLARFGRRTPLSMRLGLRDALRNMPRTGPAVGAITGTMMICAVVFLSITGGPVNLTPQSHVNAIRITANKAVASDASPYAAIIKEKQTKHSAPLRVDEYSPYYSSQRGGPVEINVNPPTKYVSGAGSRPSVLDSFSTFNNWDNGIAVHVVTPSVIGMLADNELKSLNKKDLNRLEETIAHGGAVAFNPSLVKSGKISVDITKKMTDEEDSRHELLAMAVLGAHTNAIVISPETARSLGSAAVFQASHLVGGSKLSWWETLNPDYSGEGFASVTVSKQSASQDRFGVTIAMFLSWVLCFGLILLLVALASFETRREVITMFSLGGEKRLIRRFSAMQGLFVALVGAVGAIAWLLALEFAESIRLHGDYIPFRVFDIPWIVVGVHAVGVVFVGWLTGYLYGVKRGRDYDSLVPRR